MSKSRQAIEQDLKRDEVAEGVHAFVMWVKAKRRALIGVGAAILALLIILSVWGGRRDKVTRESNAALAQALEQFNALSLQGDPKERETALQTLETTTNGLIDNYGGSKPALYAQYIQGHAYYQVDRFGDARAAYEKYLAAAETTEERARGEMALGYSFENEAFLTGADQARSTLEEGLKHYGNAATIAAGGNEKAPELPYLYYYALLGQARVNELLRNNAEAIALYEQVVNSRPAPVAVAEAPTDEEDSANRLFNLVRDQMTQQEAQLSYQASAKLRLDRLKAQAAAPAVAPATSTAPAAPAIPEAAPAAPAVTPEAAPVATAPAAAAPTTATAPAQ